MIARPSVILWLIVASAAACTSSGSSWSRAAAIEREGSMVKAAREFEKLGREKNGRAAALAWHRAGRLWIDPDNSRRSYGRALACFERVDLKVVDAETAKETRSWILVLRQFVNAREAAQETERLRDALRDIAE